MTVEIKMLEERAVANHLYEQVAERISRLIDEGTLRPGDTIAIESPTFFGILQMIESLGMRVCEIPTYPREGICLDELEARLDSCRIKACLFTPNFSNPLGSCMPEEKKFQNFIRLNCGNLWSDQIENSLARLGKIMKEMGPSNLGPASRPRAESEAQ